MRRNLPPRWRVVRFDEVAEVVTGTTPSTAHREYYDGPIPFVTPSDLDDRPVVSTAKSSLSDLGAGQARVLPPGTVMVCCIGATIGKVGIAGVSLATNQQINSLIFNEEIIDGRFAYHYCRTLKDVFRQLGTSTTLPILNKGRFSELIITVPPMSEQQRIAGILDKADALRRKRQQALQLTEQFLRSTFLDMFGDPARNPKGWPRRKIESVLNQERAGTRCGPFGTALQKSEYVADGVPVWGIDNVLPNEFVESGSLFITKQKYTQLTAYSVEPGDILISRAGTVGRMCVARPTRSPSIIGTNLIRVSLNRQGMVPEYLTALFTYFAERMGHLKANAKDNAYSFMKTGVLTQIAVPLPPINEQHHYADVVAALRTHRDRQADAVGIGDNLFHSLVQRAFRGEL